MQEKQNKKTKTCHGEAVDTNSNHSSMPEENGIINNVNKMEKWNNLIQQVSTTGSRSSDVTELSSIEELDGDVIRIGRIELDEAQELGRGSDGTFVYHGTFEGKPIAVKRLLRGNFTLAHREIDLLREVKKHPNVIRYLCDEMNRQFIYIAMELCAATLEDYVSGRYGQGIIKDVDILKQATSGLAYLHYLKIVHRDIKPHNILLSVNNYGLIIAKLSDFGLCKKLKHEQHYFTQSSGIKGTRGWIAPEIMQLHDKPTCSVDIFSMGCLFYYVLSKGKHPFGDDFSEQQLNIKNGKFSLEYLNGNENALVYNLIKKMISHDPNKRPNATKVLKHPFFGDATRENDFHTSAGCVESCNETINVNSETLLDDDNVRIQNFINNFYIVVNQKCDVIEKEIKQSIRDSIENQYQDETYNLYYKHIDSWYEYHEKSGIKISSQALKKYFETGVKLY